MLKLQDSCISNVGRGAIYRGLFIRGALLFVCFACSLVSCVRMTKTSLVKNRARWPIRVHGRAVKPARGGGKPCNRCFNMRPGRVVFGRWFLVSWFTDWANLSRKRARSLSDPRWRQRLIRGKAWVWSATAWRHRGASHSARSFFSLLSSAWRCFVQPMRSAGVSDVTQAQRSDWLIANVCLGISDWVWGRLIHQWLVNSSKILVFFSKFGRWFVVVIRFFFSLFYGVFRCIELWRTGILLRYFLVF